MYKAIYTSDTGQEFILGSDGNNVFDIEGLSGIAVNLGTSQGFGQVGESVESLSITGKTLTVTGVLYGNIGAGKQKLRKAFPAFSKGRLVFDGKYVLPVYVKNAPEFSPIKDRGRFALQLYAPFPFFREVEERVHFIGNIVPAFSFPVNYSTSHKFGEKSPARYTNIVNTGDIKTPFKAVIVAEIESSNIVLSNIKTGQRLEISGTLRNDERIELYRDSDGIFRADLISAGSTEDILYRIGEGSTLFDLNVGDNLIMVSDDTDGAYLTVQIIFQPIVGGVYET